ncbi:MAG: pantetheine-phosphate adenylyltransferase [Hyphomicrobiales bacterium]|nr:pantetheine-phosphate adenylyltransferase [Hyphomicrobiales bacterium]
MRTAFYPGSFDPATHGHMDIIRRAARMFDRVVVGVGAHHGKTPLFSAEERVAILREEAERLSLTRVAVATFSGLAVAAARDHGAQVILRGLRDAADFAYEAQMAAFNASMAPDLETAFLAAAPEHRHLASSFVRQIAQMGGDVSAFAPPAAATRLTQKFSKTL